MTESYGGLTCSPRQYRWLDRATKLTAVALVAVGLDVGGGTALGIALATLGVAVGLATVIIDTQ